MNQYFKDLITRGWVMFDYKYRPSGDYATSKKDGKSGMILMDATDKETLTMYTFISEINMGKEEWSMRGLYHIKRHEGLRFAVDTGESKKPVFTNLNTILLQLFNEDKETRFPIKLRYEDDLLFFDNLPLQLMKYLLCSQMHVKVENLDFFKARAQLKTLFDSHSNMIDRGGHFVDMILALNAIIGNTRLFENLDSMFKMGYEPILKSFVRRIPLSTTKPVRSRVKMDALVESGKAMREIEDRHKMRMDIDDLIRINEIYKISYYHTNFVKFMKIINPLPDIGLPSSYVYKKIKDEGMTLEQATEELKKAMGN